MTKVQLDDNSSDRTSLKKRKIMIVDDHPITREGIARRISSESDMMVCSEAESAQEALQLIEKQQLDLILLDISLEASSGLDVLKDLRTRFPELHTLILSMHEESLYAERALRAGARGYIMKGASPEKLIQAIRQVLAGEIYLSESMTKTALARIGNGRHSPYTIEDLSDRELEVFQLIGRGFGTREIATALHLSVKTIASHRENMKLKLNLKSSSALVQHAIHWAQTNQMI
jgi:DNA-binding NarL/FixJ family response regulator